MGSATVQGTLWGKHAREWAELQESQVVPLYEGAFAALEPLSGVKLLDAGCGSGLALSFAAKRRADVWGVDATPELVAIAQERAPRATVQVADIEALPFEAESFDIVVAFNSLQYAAAPMNALGEFRRVVKDGGAVLIGQWGDVARCETEQLFKALRALAPPPPGTPAPLALSGDGALESRLTEARLNPFAWGEAPAPFVYRDLETAWRAMISAGPLVRVIEVAGEPAVRKVFEDVFRPSLQPDGRVIQHNVFRWVISKKSS